jgi:hypothetical protein
MTDKMAQARAEISSAEAALRRARDRLAELERLKDYPDEPKNIATITFELLMGNRNYRFGAIKANGLWYTTGKTVQAHGVTWTELVDWMREHDQRPITYINLASTGFGHGFGQLQVKG